MNHPTLTNDFKRIVLEETPLIDVRAPIEYIKGAFKNSTNLPIMNDEERHLVGTCYKEKGNAEATALGYHLVSGAVREERTAAWATFMKAHPEALLYCFRGGSRSRIAQEWMREATGMPIMRLEGGYKAFRNYLIDALQPQNITSTPIILGGYTGSGKTILLKQLENAIDLEGIANHRGSSFGQHVTPQPPQITFENNLAYALIQHQDKGYRYMILEDEGRHVGTSYLPKDLHTYFNTAGLVVIDVPLEERIQITLKEYVIDAQAEYILAAACPEQGLSDWLAYIHNSMYRLRKRLGNDRYQHMLTLVDEAYKYQLATGSYAQHVSWVRFFLTDYYDPMYHYQLETTTKPIIYRGDPQEVLAYLKSKY